MLNMIKMDLYRMVRTKSMYVVWIVMAAAIFFSTSMSKLDIDTMNKEAEQQQTENIAETVKPETINMGMSVFLPTQPGEKVTVFDQVYAGEVCGVVSGDFYSAVFQCRYRKRLY